MKLFNAILIAEPFIQAAVISTRATKTTAKNTVWFYQALAKTLTSEEAVIVYETLWLLCQLTFWSTLLAIKCTIQAGRAFRRYYEAKWANTDDIQWLIKQYQKLIKQYQNWKAASVETIPDLGPELEPEVLSAEINRAVSKPVPVAYSSMTQTSSNPGETLSVAEPLIEPAEEKAVTQTITQQEQTIVDSGSSITNKLRQLAKLHGIPRRVSGKARSNPDLRADLKPLVSVALP